MLCDGTSGLRSPELKSAHYGITPSSPPGAGPTTARSGPPWATSRRGSGHSLSFQRTYESELKNNIPELWSCCLI